MDRNSHEIVPVADLCGSALRNMVRLTEWLDRVDMPMDRELVPLMCLQSSFFAPWLPADSCLRIAQLTSWLMALDDALDDPGASSATLAALLDVLRRIVEGGASEPAEPLARALAEIRDALWTEGDDRAETAAFWRDSMHETLTGMWYEHEAAGNAEQPSLQRYLTYGAWTIGVEQQLATLWALMDDPDLPRRLPVLRDALRHAATAIRLANDVRGHQREQRHGQIDALVIGLSAQQARARLDESVEQCRLLLAPMTSIGYGPAVALERTLLWHARMYARFDPVRPQDHEAAMSIHWERGQEMGIEQELLAIIVEGRECDNETLERYFEKLEPVDADYLIGAWKGGVFETSSEDYKLLEQMSWYGKRFLSREHVEPLLCRRPDGSVYSFEDMGLAAIHDVVFRGRSSAAMVYDQLPIIDQFRRVSDDVMLGYMNKKGATSDLYFSLTRVPDPTAAPAGVEATAAVLRSGGGAYSVEQVELAEPGEGEVLVKITGAGLCHTDLVARSELFAAALPIVVGHEGAGVVEQVGPGVHDVSVGDHVVLSFDSCRRCVNCRDGHPAYCETFTARNMTGRRLDGSTPMRAADGGPVAAHWFAQSSLASRVVASAAAAVVVDASLPLEKLGPLGCGVQTGAGAVLRALKVPAGATIAIFGVGTVGLSAVMAAKVAGAARIIAVDLLPERLQLAREFGATDTLPGDAADLADRIRELSDGGVRYALDTTGVPAVISAGIAALRTTGTMGLVGLQSGVLELDGLALGIGKTLVGIVEGDSAPREFIPQLISLWQQGRFPFDRLVSTYPLGSVNDAERDMLAGKAVKPVLLPA
ncbi:MAG TPA: zinc-binding dehydrogenase [Actinospica sp.]|nr:zinc-binding dehydrogenase [Actinospica sp.]